MLTGAQCFGFCCFIFQRLTQSVVSLLMDFANKVWISSCWFSYHCCHPQYYSAGSSQNNKGSHLVVTPPSLTLTGKSVSFLFWRSATSYRTTQKKEKRKKRNEHFLHHFVNTLAPMTSFPTPQSLCQKFSPMI